MGEADSAALLGDDPRGKGVVERRFVVHGGGRDCAPRLAKRRDGCESVESGRRKCGETLTAVSRVMVWLPYVSDRKTGTGARRSLGT